MSSSESLRKEFKATLWPFFERSGFVRGKATSLFAPFSRPAADVVHVFHVQWDKYHRPRFVINFGEVRASILASLPAEELKSMELVNHSENLLRLKRGRGGTMGSWFQLRKPFWTGLATLSWNYTPAEVVGQVIANFPEVEAWWKTRQIGPNIGVLRTSSRRSAEEARPALRDP